MLRVAIQERALMKLQQLHAAEDLCDLAIPVSNQFEALKGNRRGQHSVRINLQSHYDLQMVKDRIGKRAAKIEARPRDQRGTLQPLG
jgi:plasmid maintenance system killer protein